MADAAGGFEAEYRRAHASLWLLAAGMMGDRHAADDVLQEAVMAALARQGDFRPGTNFRAWLASFVRFVAMNHRRRERRHLARPIDAADEAFEAGSVVAVDASDLLSDVQPHLDDRLMRALDDVEPTARACLLLRVVDGLNYREIASCLDVPEGTAMSHVFRAKATLRRALGGAGGVDA